MSVGSLQISMSVRSNFCMITSISFIWPLSNISDRHKERLMNYFTTSRCSLGFLLELQYLSLSQIYEKLDAILRSTYPCSTYLSYDNQEYPLGALSNPLINVDELADLTSVAAELHSYLTRDTHSWNSYETRSKNPYNSYHFKIHDNIYTGLCSNTTTESSTTCCSWVVIAKDYIRSCTDKMFVSGLSFVFYRTGDIYLMVSGLRGSLSRELHDKVCNCCTDVIQILLRKIAEIAVRLNVKYIYTLDNRSKLSKYGFKPCHYQRAPSTFICGAVDPSEWVDGLYADCKEPLCVEAYSCLF